MKIALIGYGRMGRQIEAEAQAMGLPVVARIEAGGQSQISELDPAQTVAIEFSTPEAALANVAACLHQGLPVVSGTTGWQPDLPKARHLCQAHR